MGWKSVAWAGCLLPVLAGCGTARHAAPDWQPAPAAVAPDGRAAWNRLRADYPTHAFSGEFRDGFLDGYAGARGQVGQLTAPPAKLPRRGRHAARHEPNCDYCCGFRYGSDTAASGWRMPPPPTVPVRPPGDPPPAPRPPRSDSPADPLPKKQGVRSDDAGGAPTLPKPEVPVIPAFDPPLGDWKFPPLPKAPVMSGEPTRAIPPTALPTQPLLPRVDFPVLPASVKAPSILDDVPAVPFRYPEPGK
jgi:hypothetical protein